MPKRDLNFFFFFLSLRSECISTDLADEGKGLAPHPLGTVAEPDCELIDEVQTQVISTTRVQLLEDLYDLRTYGKARSLEKGLNMQVLFKYGTVHSLWIQVINFRNSGSYFSCGND